jgi:hypothetical protein
MKLDSLQESAEWTFRCPWKHDLPVTSESVDSWTMKADVFKFDDIARKFALGMKHGNSLPLSSNPVATISTPWPLERVVIPTLWRFFVKGNRLLGSLSVCSQGV